MKRCLLATLLWLGLTLGWSAPACAGAWTLKAGEGQVISTLSFSTADQAFDARRKAADPVAFSKTEQSVFLEYGLSSRFTLVASGAVQDITYEARDGLERFSGLAPGRVGVRMSVPSPTKPWVMAVQPSLIIPSGGETVPDADLGQGGTGAELRVLAGRNLTFGGRSGFFDAQAAYEIRDGNEPRQTSLDLTLGVSVTPKLQVLAQGFAQHTTEGLFKTDRVLENDSVKIQGSLVYRYSQKSSVQIGAFTTPLGRNTVKQSGLSVGLWQRF